MYAETSTASAVRRRNLMAFSLSWMGLAVARPHQGKRRSALSGSLGACSFESVLDGGTDERGLDLGEPVRSPHGLEGRRRELREQQLDAVAGEVVVHAVE